jgi:hypothetical protein
MSNFTNRLQDVVPLGCSNQQAQAELITAICATRAALHKMCKRYVPNVVVQERVMARADDHLLALMRLLVVDFNS